MLYFQRILICTVILSALLHNNVHAKSTLHKEIIESKSFSEPREAFVQLPESYYKQPHKTYPVIYRLDGKGNIPMVSAMLNKLHLSGDRPEVIIVAIESSDRTFDMTPTINHDPRGPVGKGGGADKFLDYIEKELIPLINSKYRTHDFKVISGSSIGGLFAIHALHSRPHLFQAYIAYSPAVWWGDRTTTKLTKEFIRTSTNLDSYLYINIGEEEGEMRDVYENFTSYLQLNTPSELRLFVESFDGVAHGLTSAVGAFNAYHKLFLPLHMPFSVFDGNTASIDKYYQEITNQRGEKILPPELALYNIGARLIAKKQFDKALEVFKFSKQLRPLSAWAHNDMAYGYEQNGQYKQALEQVKLALSLASKGDEQYNLALDMNKRLGKKLN